MPIELLLERRPFGLIAATAADRDILAKIPIGKLVRARITRTQSQKMLRFYWRVVELVAKGIGMSKTGLSQELLIRTGYVESVIFHVSGAVHRIPLSIAEMESEERKEYVDAAVELICREYINLKRNALIHEAEQTLGFTYEQAKQEK